MTAEREAFIAAVREFTDAEQVILEKVRVPLANRLGAEGAGSGIAMNGLSGGRPNNAASSTGSGERRCSPAEERTWAR